MARAVKKSCLYPGCIELVEPGTGAYCEEHTKTTRRVYDNSRGTSKERGYDSWWRKFREHYLQHHPLCTECLKQGKVTQATEIHHLMPLKKGGTNAESNLQALCKSCHSRITRESK